MGLGFHICVWQNLTSINSDIVGNAKLLKQKVSKKKNVKVHYGKLKVIF